MSGETMILGVPSKGRLMEQAGSLFTSAGLSLRKTGHERGYRGDIAGLGGVEVAFLSATEIAWDLAMGRVHMGITGERCRNAGSTSAVWPIWRRSRPPSTQITAGGYGWRQNIRT
jgi:ATP phosphoribosyltransferase